MWRRHDQPFLEDYYPHFYRLLTKGLSSSDPQVITAILSNSRKLFVLGLPGSYILVKPFLCCIRNMSGTSYTPGILNLPATVHQNAITILQSLISVPNHYTTPTPTIRRPGSAPPHMQSSSSASPRTLAPSRMTKGEDLQVGSDYSINRERHGIHRSSPKSIVTSSLGVLPPPLLTPSPASLVAAARTCSSEISAPTARTAKTFAASMTQLTTRGKYEDTARSHPISLTSDVAVQETRGVSHPDLTLGLTSTPHRTTGGTLFGVPSIGDAAEQLESYVPSGGKIISSEEMKLAIKDTLVFLLSSSPEDRDITSLQMLNWSVATMLFDEIVNSANPNKAVLDDCLSALLRNLTHRDVAVVYAASDGLSLLAQNRDILGKLDKHMLQFVLETLVNTTMDLLLLQHGHSGSQVRALCVSRLLYCLLDWVMIFPDDVRDYTKLADMIFDVIEQALNVPLEVDISVSSQGDSERGQPVPFKRGGRTSVYEGNIFQRHSSDGGRPGPGDKADAVAAAPLSAVTGGKGMEDAAGNTMIKDTAEIVLTHILNHVHNFAPPYGAAMMGSQILDPSLQEEGSRRESDKYLYFSFNRTTLITLVEIPGRTPLDTRARLIIRDMSGRYCWDSSLFYESLHNMRKRLHSGRSNVFNDISNRFAADPCQYRGVSQSLIFPEGVGLESHPRELEA
ncbi:uncharacterized protein EV422DRAFT_354572 [Fimicolochytrium jonesii]|uniref:uncharacterized protein n=1 Tax=Fimicolochytrium jonesii TaxID=1396493 RepID=UPI0022FF3D24|nr:uncharacterized protein EV422DRAFT_354572 [Fimicolochytrium jonesii]KAI8823427.1 hypothetical protein EV422DRAFT_354572 [Fimicolochytrium jonesii]